jgi:hypothetical protein
MANITSKAITVVTMHNCHYFQDKGAVWEKSKMAKERTNEKATLRILVRSIC